MPQVFVPSGYVAPPLKALKGSQVRRLHTPRNEEHVGLGPGGLSRLRPRPSPANSPTYIQDRSITALLAANLLRMGQARVRFDKLRSNTVMSVPGASRCHEGAGPSEDDPLRASPPPDRLVGGRTHEVLVRACLSPLGHLAKGGWLAD